MTVDNLRVHPWGGGWWGWHGCVRHDRWWTGGPVGDQGFCAHHWLLGVATHPWGLHRLCAMQWITWKESNHFKMSQLDTNNLKDYWLSRPSASFAPLKEMFLPGDESLEFLAQSLMRCDELAWSCSMTLFWLLARSGCQYLHLFP